MTFDYESLNTSGGSPLQIIQTIGPYTPPLFGTVVPTGSTYVIGESIVKVSLICSFKCTVFLISHLISAVSPQCVSPGAQILPLSPGKLKKGHTFRVSSIVVCVN